MHANKVCERLFLNECKNKQVWAKFGVYPTILFVIFLNLSIDIKVASESVHFYFIVIQNTYILGSDIIHTTLLQKYDEENS